MITVFRPSLFPPIFGSKPWPPLHHAKRWLVRSGPPLSRTVCVVCLRRTGNSPRYLTPSELDCQCECHAKHSQFRAFLLPRRARRESEINRLDCHPFAMLPFCRASSLPLHGSRNSCNSRSAEHGCAGGFGFIMGWFAKPLLQPSFHVLIGAPKRKRFAGLEPTIWAS